MEGVVSLGGLGALLLLALVRAYTGRVLTQKEVERRRLAVQERHGRQQVEREETLLESAEARLLQLETDSNRMQQEESSLRDQIAAITVQLRGTPTPDEDGEDDEDEEGGGKTAENERTKMLEGQVENLAERLEATESMLRNLLATQNGDAPPGAADEEEPSRDEGEPPAPASL